MITALRRKMRNQKGFTLVELLVVIAIIGVLAAVAIPKFADSTAAARTAKVQGDLQALDTAISLYIANNSGNVPADTNAILPFMSDTTTLPSVAAGKYRLAGSTVDIPATSYTLTTGKDRAQVKLNDVDYTAATLKP